jgi:hypothetical protein
MEDTMPKLTDAQLTILAAAAKRDDGSILPLPKKLKLNGKAATATLEALIRKKLAVEQNLTSGATIWREDDGHRMMLVISQTGLQAIGAVPRRDIQSGVGPAEKKARAGRPKPPKPASRKRQHGGTARAAAAKPGVSARPGTKQAKIIGLLRRPDGASVAEIMKVTGWQAHSVRGVISGALKKKLGFVILAERSESGERRYRIAG